MTTFHKRMKRGLRWNNQTPPKPTANEIAATVFMVLLIVLAYLIASYRDAQAGMMEAQAKQIKAEVALVTILNGDPLVIDKESGMVALAKVEVIGEYKNRLTNDEN